MVTVFNLIDEKTLSELRVGVAYLHALLPRVKHGPVSETVDLFSIKLYPETDTITATLNTLRDHADLFEIIVNVEIYNRRFSLSLIAGGIKPKSATEMPCPTDLSLDENQARVFQEFASHLAETPPPLPLDTFASGLQNMLTAGLSPLLDIAILMNKAKFLKDLGFETIVQPVLYIFSEKFLQKLQDPDLWKVFNWLLDSPHETLIILLGDVEGLASGPNNRICGIDHWRPLDVNLAAGDEACQLMADTREFRRRECYWQVGELSLTPYHLLLEKATLSRVEITNAIGELNNRLAVVHLSQHTSLNYGALQSEIRGYKQVEVSLSPLDQNLTKTPAADIVDLFKWSYENHSSDKLGIVRQIISLLLDDQTDDNYMRLTAKAGDILISSKSNFQLFLKRNVELYFDKRLRVSQYLQKFTDEVDKSIAEITTDLIGNLYKTIGLIIGVFIAALIDPAYTPQVALLAAILYLIYLLFILFYWLPSMNTKFCEQVREYDHAVVELQDVLAQDEIKKLQGEAFDRSRDNFRRYYGVTKAIYIIMAIIAVVLALYFFTVGSIQYSV